MNSSVNCKEHGPQPETFSGPGYDAKVREQLCQLLRQERR